MQKTILLFGAAMLAAGSLVTQLHAQGSTQSIEISRVDIRTVEAGYRASKVIGSKVYNDTDETIGMIDELLVTADGKDPYAVLSVGGFLGIGDRLVVVRYDSLRFAVNNKIVLPGGSKDGLKMLPAFNYKSE